MDPIAYIRNMTSDDVMRYTRIVLQWIAATLVTHGSISPTATWVEPAIGVGVGVVSLMWTIYGTRLKAKLVDAEKSGAVIVTTPEMAAATPNSPNIVSSADVKVMPK